MQGAEEDRGAGSDSVFSALLSLTIVYRKPRTDQQL